MKYKTPPSIIIEKPLRKTTIKKSYVTVDEVDKVRGTVLNAVKDALPNARGALNGRIRWTNQQVKLFQIMLNKVLPDLSASMNDHLHKHRTIDQLTRDELMEIASQGRRIDKEDPLDAIDAEYNDLPDITADEAAEQFNAIKETEKEPIDEL